MANFSALLSPDQAGAGLYGANRINDIYNRILENQKLGIANRYMPGTLQAEMAKKQAEAQYYGPNIENEMNLRNFQAQQAGSHSNLMNEQARMIEPKTQAEINEINEKIRQGKDPYSKISTYPELFKAQSLYRHYADTLGEEHPITTDAKKNYEIMQKNAKGMGEWRQAMTQTAPFRFLTPVAKEIEEAGQANAGLYPSAMNSPAGLPIAPQQNMPPNTGSIPSELTLGNQTTMQQSSPIPPSANITQANNPSPSSQYKSVMNPQEMAGLLTSAAIKKSTTSAQLNRSVAGAYADRTLENMLQDQPAMEYFTGAQGRTKLASEKANAAFGKSSPEYQAYERYKTNGALLATQLRMFYGDSVQEEAAKKLEDLTNPSAWNKDPAAAREKLDAFVKTFRQERQITQRALFNPMSVHQENPADKAPIKTLSEVKKIGNSQAEKILNGKRYIKQNNKWHEV